MIEKNGIETALLKKPDFVSDQKSRTRPFRSAVFDWVKIGLMNGGKWISNYNFVVQCTGIEKSSSTYHAASRPEYQPLDRSNLQLTYSQHFIEYFEVIITPSQVPLHFPPMMWLGASWRLTGPMPFFFSAGIIVYDLWWSRDILDPCPGWSWVFSKVQLIVSSPALRDNPRAWPTSIEQNLTPFTFFRPSFVCTHPGFAGRKGLVVEGYAFHERSRWWRMWLMV